MCDGKSWSDEQRAQQRQFLAIAADASDAGRIDPSGEWNDYWRESSRCKCAQRGLALEPWFGNDAGDSFCGSCGCDSCGGHLEHEQPDPDEGEAAGLQSADKSNRLWLIGRARSDSTIA